MGFSTEGPDNLPSVPRCVEYVHQAQPDDAIDSARNGTSGDRIQVAAPPEAGRV